MTSTASILLSLSIALLAGLLLSRSAKKVQLPAVSAYLIAGVLIGPFVLGALGIPGIGITESQLEGFGIISDLSLGFIAFSMGNEFRLAQLKKIGRNRPIIFPFQALINYCEIFQHMQCLCASMPDRAANALISVFSSEIHGPPIVLHRQRPCPSRA